MKGFERHLLKGAVTLAGFLVVLAAVENLKGTAEDIGTRRVAEAKASQAKVQKAEIPTYPAPQKPADPALTVTLTNAQMAEIDRWEADRKARRERQQLTPECQFWWQQNDQAPTERTAQKKAEHCDR